MYKVLLNYKDTVDCYSFLSALNNTSCLKSDLEFKNKKVFDQVLVIADPLFTFKPLKKDLSINTLYYFLDDINILQGSNLGHSFICDSKSFDMISNLSADYCKSSIPNMVNIVEICLILNLNLKLYK